MKYRVIKPFTDLQDSNFVYHVGDLFPHEGEASAERLKELSSEANKMGMPLIEQVEEEIEADTVMEEKPKPRRNRRKNAD